MMYYSAVKSTLKGKNEYPAFFIQPKSSQINNFIFQNYIVE